MNHRNKQPEPSEQTNLENIVSLAWGEDIEEHSAAPPPPSQVERKATRTKVISRARELRNELQRVADAAIKEVVTANPVKFAGLKAATTTVVLPESSGATRMANRAIVQRILSPEGAASTQTAIRQHVEKYFGVGAPKDWTKPTPAWLLPRIREAVRNAPAPFNEIEVKRGITLRKLHREAVQLYRSRQGDGLSIKATITLTADTVLINKRAWKINPTTQRIIVTIKQLRDLGA
ncbi:hypothetical protein [Variovorax sp. KBW07]|uniref:hypothetical protein n=1 Tax=Variovorax sp. KBW07 TaxID=2153358 RepID=UPI000F5815BE|nr:hypothetical protein [Variovorax sp. KBW07]